MSVSDFLSRIGMDEYINDFADNDIDSATLTGLNSDDLKEIGVSSLGHRKKILAAIKDAASNNNSPPKSDSGTVVNSDNQDKDALAVVNTDKLVVSKRSTALALDFFMLLAIIIFERFFITMEDNLQHFYVFLICLYFLPEAFGLQGLGKRLSKIKICNRDGSKASTGNLLKRYFIKTGPILFSWGLFMIADSIGGNMEDTTAKILLFLSILVLLFYILILISLNKLLKQESVEAMHDTLSKTRIFLADSKQ